MNEARTWHLALGAIICWDIVPHNSIYDSFSSLFLRLWLTLLSVPLPHRDLTEDHPQAHTSLTASPPLAAMFSVREATTCCPHKHPQLSMLKTWFIIFSERPLCVFSTNGSTKCQKPRSQSPTEPACWLENTQPRTSDGCSALLPTHCPFSRVAFLLMERRLVSALSPSSWQMSPYSSCSRITLWENKRKLWGNALLLSPSHQIYICICIHFVSFCHLSNTVEHLCPRCFSEC